jgi:hypothetical protein
MGALFWNDVNTEPKRRFRFELSFTQRNGDQTKDIPVWTIKTAAKPKANISTITHTYVDHEFNYPGRVTWEPITITLVDPVQPDLSFAFLDVLGVAGYKYPRTAGISKASLSKKGFKDAIGTVLIKQLDADGTPVEVWELVNPFITSVDFGGALSYDDDEMSEVTVEITYDWANLTRHSGNSTTKTAAG